MNHFLSANLPLFRFEWSARWLSDLLSTLRHQAADEWQNESSWRCAKQRLLARVSPADTKKRHPPNKTRKLASFSSALTFQHVDTSSKTSTSSNHSGGFSWQLFPFSSFWPLFHSQVGPSFWKLSRRWPVPLHQRRRADRFTYSNAFQQLSALLLISVGWRWLVPNCRDFPLLLGR